MKFLWLATLLTLAVSVYGEIALAGDVRQQQSQSAWRKEDQCARDAFAKFPDYTRESNAARDRLMRDCEIRSGIPVRAPVNASPVKTVPDDEAN